MAANGPKGVSEIAGEFGDGWITAVGSPAEVKAQRALIDQGARKAGRKLNADFLTTALIGGCVLRLSGSEKLTDDRVIDETGSFVSVVLHFAYEIWKDLGKNDALDPGRTSSTSGTNTWRGSRT